MNFDEMANILSVMCDNGAAGRVGFCSISRLQGNGHSVDDGVIEMLIEQGYIRATEGRRGDIFALTPRGKQLKDKVNVAA